MKQGEVRLMKRVEVKRVVCDEAGRGALACKGDQHGRRSEAPGFIHLHLALADQLVGKREQRIGALRAVLRRHKAHQRLRLEPNLRAGGLGWGGGGGGARG